MKMIHYFFSTISASCKLVRCLNNLTCVEDQYGLPHCISCTISCPQDDASPVIDPSRAVCGVDGLTYKSICDINRLICTTGRSIAVAYYGLCKGKCKTLFVFGNIFQESDNKDFL